MEEKLKELAGLLNKLEEASKAIQEGIHSPLVEYNSPAFPFLLSADFSLDNAKSALYGKYAAMVQTSNHGGDLS